MRKPTQKVRHRDSSGCGTRFLIFLIILAAFIVAAVFLVKYYNNSDIGDRIKKSQYPIKYEHFVDEYSKKYNLDKYLVYGVIRTESRFDIYAVSDVKAKGLMQITDETGRDCAKKMGLSKYSDDMLFDPETNIAIGCYYLSNLLKKYKNDINSALAAYNGGPARVDEWIKDSKYYKNGTLVEIPYSETRIYVQKVKEAMNEYKSLYKEKNT